MNHRFVDDGDDEYLELAEAFESLRVKYIKLEEENEELKSRMARAMLKAKEIGPHIEEIVLWFRETRL